MIKIKVKRNSDLEVDEVLEKALKSIKEKEKTPIRDPYIKKLLKEAGDIYDIVTAQMIEDILDVMYKWCEEVV